MNKLTAILLLATITAIAGCGTKTTSSKKSTTTSTGLPETIQLGQSTAEDVKKELGEPDYTYTMNESIVSSYAGNMSIKFTQNKAKAFFRNPSDNEVYLQYWLQKWKDKKTKQDPIAETKNVHGQYEYQLACAEDNTTIIYNNENGTVKRVIYYEK